MPYTINNSSVVTASVIHITLWTCTLTGLPTQTHITIAGKLRITVYVKDGEAQFHLSLHCIFCTEEELEILKKQLAFKDKVISQLILENERLNKEHLSAQLIKRGQGSPVRQGTSVT